MRTLQDQHLLIKEGKGSKDIFLKTAKSQYPNLITNPMSYQEASQILENKGIISENVQGLEAVGNYHSPDKQPFEVKFDNFLKEAQSKANSKKVDGEVKEASNKNYDYEDYKNLDNQIGQEVQNGIYFEAQKNPDKSIEEVKKIVSKNLNKDSQYYMKNAAFGVEGIGYKESEQKQVTGKHASSGYSEKLKKLAKESLLKEGIHNRDITSNSQTKEGVSEGEGDETNSVDDEDIEKTQELTNAVQDLDKAKEEAGIEEEQEEPKPKPKKKKRQTTDDKLKDIETQSEIVTLETKLDTLDEIIESKNQRISMVQEDENLSDLVDKKKIKELQKEVKNLEKQKAKLEKLYEKKSGKSYQKEEVIDEDEEEDFDN